MRGLRRCSPSSRVCSCHRLILIHPDPEAQFIMEVDTSNIGIRAMLSQRSSRDSKVHPCAFFSRRLSAAEQNCDIGNRELLAVKMALEEWRHWLEGAQTPFQVWTDHKNLEYLQTAKRLTPRPLGLILCPIRVPSRLSSWIQER